MKKIKKSKKSKKNQKKGFTLIEILVVSTIIVVVSAIGLVSFSSISVGARDAQRSKDLENVRTTLLLFRSENGYYPIAGLEAPSRITFSLPRKVMARLASAFIVEEVQAVAVDDQYISPIDDGYTPPPTDDFVIATATPTPTFVVETALPTGIEIIKPTPTPTPTSTPTSTPIIETPVPSPTSTPTIDPEATPADKTAYGKMVDELVDSNYYMIEEIPHDPVNNNIYYYGYESVDGSGFELTARLEKDSSVLTLTN